MSMLYTKGVIVTPGEPVSNCDPQSSLKIMQLVQVEKASDALKWDSKMCSNHAKEEEK